LIPSGFFTKYCLAIIDGISNKTIKAIAAKVPPAPMMTFFPS
jgi:hypothetical protein